MDKKNNMNPTQQENSGLSRRGFLKGAAASAIGAAAVGFMGGCSNTTANPGSTSTANPAVLSPDGIANYEVINTDLLIIGAGFGGLSAAFEAINKGLQVTIVDKGPFRHGGGAGFNWDVITTWETVYGKESRLKNIVNQNIYYNASTTDPNANMALTLLNRGECLPDRNADGSVHWYIDYPIVKGVEGTFPRNHHDAVYASPNVTVYDRTMITDILINDGVCLGAMGINLPTGEFRVFRSPATILSTGGSCWFYGWNSVSCDSINSADNTGDVDMAAFRHGIGIGDSEYGQYDFASTYPQGLAFGWSTMLNPDANEYYTICDRDGNKLVTKENGVDLERITYDRVYFNQSVARLLNQGKATDEGGILIDVKGVHLRPPIQRNIPVFESFNVDVESQLVPGKAEMYEHGGTPLIDDNMMSEVKGFFCVRGAGVFGAGGGSCVSVNHRMGSYTTRCAIEYMKTAAPIAEIDWSPVEKEYARLHEIRTRKADGGLRPHVVRQKIQKTSGTCMGIIREKDKLEAAKAELARIRKEDIPKMFVSDQSPTYNNEWKEAIEAYNLLDLAELAVNATLERKETRGQYLRTDFPEMDDINFKCMLVAYQKDDQLTFEKKTMPEVTQW
ncbi:Periplasmic fumarate reductase-like flavoprotein [Desulfitobacterium hafniense]|uniref:Periplasmic fumarate reductase-like flavoprotein n=1 Tax=Desulfitobacterium hafniense TaxID=49338 RepID=A0A098B555_DESHA|nr:FAD-binding protein [Desulfitobacterium hafniense]CDX03969.1 Periplasmic fumarate reductase-like flavoprotein [Desulfitobacterium hafniense]